MIFVSVGTTIFPFQRVDDSIKSMHLNSTKYNFIYQNPTTKLKSSKCLRVYKDLAYPTFIKYLKNAKGIITHGGPATILLSLQYSKYKPLVIPRQKKFFEHVNDHQVFFAKDLHKKNMIELSLASQPTQDIYSYFKRKPKNIYNGIRGKNTSLIKKLTTYTNKI